MRANVMIDKLRRDEPVFGPMIMDLSGPGLPQIVANAGMPVAAVSPERLASWVGDRIRNA